MNVQTPKVNFTMKTFFLWKVIPLQHPGIGAGPWSKARREQSFLVCNKSGALLFQSGFCNLIAPQVLSSILDGLKHPAPFLIHQCSLTFLPKKLQAPGQNPTQNSAILLFQATPRSLGIKHEIYYLATLQRFSDTSNHQATLLPFLLLHWQSWPCTWSGNAAHYPLHTLEENTGERGTSELDPTSLPDCHLSGHGMSWH